MLISIAAALIIGAIGYSSLLAMIPVNGDFPVFNAPANIYIKSIDSSQGGFVFAKQSTQSSRAYEGLHNPTYTFAEGSLVSLHFINDDHGVPNVKHIHNLNIDEFNVHSHDLSSSQSQTITFIANKTGTFHYYCSLHPEMNGKIVINNGN